MPLQLYIPPCVHTPTGPYHFPPPEKPLRIQIEGPLVAIQRLFPDAPWHIDVANQIFPQPAGIELAKLTYQKIYGKDISLEIPGDMVLRDQYLGWVPPPSCNEIDYYGVTFDHLVPADDTDPEVLQINIIEIEDDNGAYANQWLSFRVDPVEFTGKKVLAVPRCCTKRKGTTDRIRVNECVRWRDEETSKKG
ncbi:hypothetical protein MaudCBS49596_004213 [Microsporum audouinii]